MLTKEVRDEFVIEYELECQKRNVPRIELGDKILASWIASGQQKIADSLKILVRYTDIEYEAMTEFTTYGLPDDYGSFIGTEPKLTVKGITDLTTLAQEGETLDSGEIDSIAIYHDGDGYKVGFMNLPSSSGTIRIWYSINPLYYSPSSGKNQEWGTFDGTTFSGYLRIPDKYKDLLILFMLGKCFDDKKQEFIYELQSFVSNSGSTSKDEICYTAIGGF